MYLHLVNPLPRLSAVTLCLAGICAAVGGRAEIIVDNADARVTGDWTAITATSAYGGDALLSPAGAGASTAAYRPVLDREGIYEIFLRWPEDDAARGSNVPVIVEAADHTRNVRVDMRSGGGRWNSIGEYRLPAGTKSGVVITDMGDGFAAADAVEFVWKSVPPAAGNVYYVAPGGDDGGPGTLAQPWGTIRKAASAMYPGDTTYIRGGTYSGGAVPARSGSAHAYIGYVAYPGEAPVLQGGGVNGFDLTGLSWIRIEGLTIGGFSENGILAGNGAHDIEVIDCTLAGNSTGTVWAGGFMALQNSSEIYLENCVARDNGGFGFASDMYPRVRYLTLSSCESYQNGNDGFGLYADRPYLKECISHENGWNITNNGDDFDLNYSTDAIFERCMAWGSTLNQYKIGAGYNVLAGCIGADTQVAGYGRSFSIMLGNAARGAIYNCDVRGIRLKGAGPYALRNNVIRKNGSSSSISVALYCDSASVALRSDRNLFLPDVRYGVNFNPLMHVGPDPGGVEYASLAAWQETGQDAHSISSAESPFVDERVPVLDFRLKAGCAAIDAGTSDGAPSSDRFGCGRWDDPSVGNEGEGARPYVDIGACEYLTEDADTDGDGVPDYDEIAYDGVEFLYTPGFDLDPLSADTDGDGVGDGVEFFCPGGAPLAESGIPQTIVIEFKPALLRPVSGHLLDSASSFTPARGYGWR